MKLQKTILITLLILATASTAIANQRERSTSNKTLFVDSHVSNRGNSCQTERVNLTHSNFQSEGDRFLHSTISDHLTDDGRYFVFESWATDLVPNDTNDSPDIFVRDLHEQTTERVSVRSDGSEAITISRTPSISDNGRFITFVANPILAGYTGSTVPKQIILRDRQTGQTTLVSKSPAGNPADSFVGSATSLSADGNIIAFTSSAQNIIPSNGIYQVFIYNQQLNTFTIASVSSAGELGNMNASNPVVSGNGRYVLFYSRADNLVLNDTNDSYDMFVHDLQTSTTKRISVSTAGEEGNTDSGFPSRGHDISDDGRYAVFMSHATNLVPEYILGADHSYLHDLQTNETVLATPLDGDRPVSGFRPSISGNGRYITFLSRDGFIIPDNNNGITDVYI